MCGTRPTQDSPDMFGEDEGAVDELEEVPAKEAIIQNAVIPQKISYPKNFQEKNKDIWVEQTPGSERAARPLITVLQRENRETIEALVDNYLEKQLIPLTQYETKTSEKNLRAPVICIAMQSGKLVPISADVNFGAMDNKLTQTLTGRTGAFCTACTATSGDMLNMQAISEGFYMDVGTDKLSQKFEELAEKLGISPEDRKEWEIPSKKGDYNERLGLKRAPVTQNFEITKVTNMNEQFKTLSTLEIG